MVAHICHHRTARICPQGHNHVHSALHFRHAASLKLQRQFVKEAKKLSFPSGRVKEERSKVSSCSPRWSSRRAVKFQGEKPSGIILRDTDKTALNKRIPGKGKIGDSRPERRGGGAELRGRAGHCFLPLTAPLSRPSFKVICCRKVHRTNLRFYLPVLHSLICGV